ncbi:nuclease-related domain-containing protein [Noviherbaspirillum sp. Root189]|uniref:nuclease-related domain-containing protein n=1 Tax=Noviherbaspirillum sp. Root189 TaxID=1736487 RepID=UPI00070DDDA5|nr:nuclease-related domain-containing protein [Noviherbaspirillum sp. Root189]KRB74254.1 hypothetical protein ASE07_26780 [Noviherbaspirillum sp. Root189]
MSQPKNSKEQSSETSFEWIPALLLLAVTVFLVYPILAIGFLFREPITRALRLEKRAERYVHSAGGIKLLKGLVICMYAGAIYALFVIAPSKDVWIERFIWTLGAICTAASGTFAYNIIHWIGELSEDPDIRRHAAGNEAEAYVKSTIDALSAVYPEARALHGTLLVFDSALPQQGEYSIEIDHLFVTRHNCYLIETKYRNATVHAATAAPQWRTTAQGGSEGAMRNALSQVKNSARVLEQALSLPYKLVPIVAIHGEHTQIVDGPANVVRSDRLPNIIAAFEQVENSKTLDPTALVNSLNPFVRTGEDAMGKHIERANQAKQRAEAKAVVNATSR